MFDLLHPTTFELWILALAGIVGLARLIRAVEAGRRPRTERHPAESEANVIRQMARASSAAGGHIERTVLHPRDRVESVRVLRKRDVGAGGGRTPDEPDDLLSRAAAGVREREARRSHEMAASHYQGVLADARADAARRAAYDRALGEGRR